MNSVPFLNSVPLRKLLRKHGNVGYLVVGLYLTGYWLYHFKRRQTLTVLTLAMAAGIFTLWTGPYRLLHGGTQTPSDIRAAYSIADLGVVSSYDYSFADKVNNKGQVSGEITDKEFEKIHGFFYSGSKMTDIGTLGGEFSVANGLNDSGQVVGTSDTNSDEVRGFVWQNGKMTRIGTLGGPFSAATGINNKGEVVGISAASSGQAHAFIWNNGSMRDISAQCPGKQNAASVINDNSDIAGVFTEDGQSIHTFVLSGNKSRPLPTLGGMYAFPTGISKSQVVGYATLRGDEKVHGYAWQSGGIKDLGTLGGDTSLALGVNNNGQIVGGAETSSGMFRAALWANGKATDLNTLLPSGSGWQLIVAGGINDKGQIAGYGIVGNTVHAFLMTPKD